MNPRILTAVVLVALGLAAGLGSWYALLARRRRFGADHLARTLHLNARWWREHGTRRGDLLYVAIGDSAAQGVGASKPHRGYVGKIATHVRHSTGKSVRVLNLSVSGARLREALAAQVPQLADLDADLMTVAVGANDMADFDAVRFERELRTLLSALPKHAIVGEVPCFFFGAAERNARVANGILHRVAAERGLAVAPLYGATRRQGAARVAFNQASRDFFHPNDRGYRVWAGAFLPLVDASVRDRGLA